MCLFVWERENGTWKEREKVNERKRERDKRKKWLRVNDKNLTFNGWLISLSLEDSPSAKRGSSKNNKIIKNFATFDAFRDKTTVYLNCGLIKRMKNVAIFLPIIFIDNIIVINNLYSISTKPSQVKELSCSDSQIFQFIVWAYFLVFKVGILPR